MNTTLKRTFIYLILVFTLSSCAVSASISVESTRNITIVNKTGLNITSAFSRVPGAEEWSDNLIVTIIPTESSQRVTIPACSMDGKSGTDIQLRTSTLTFTLELQDLSQGSVITFHSTDLDLGPAGGIVFYDKGYYSDGWRYLESAPANSEFTASWSSIGHYITGLQIKIGTGKDNTTLLAHTLAEIGETERAAQICFQVDINGFSDWFMPSRDELDMMYQNLHLFGVGGFSNTYYWSSSQVWTDTAWFISFNHGQQGFHAKNCTYRVRAIRAF